MRGTRGRCDAGQGRVEYALGLLLIILVAVMALLILESPGGLEPLLRVASAPTELTVKRQPNGWWQITERVTIADGTETALRAENSAVSDGTEALATAILGDNQRAGWAYTERRDGRPVFERTYWLADPSGPLSIVWTVDTPVDLFLMSAYGVGIVPAEGSTAIIDAPKRLLVATAPSGESEDRLDGTRRWRLDLEERETRIVLRVAPGWARVPVGSEALRFVQDNPLVWVVGLFATTAAGAAAVFVVKRIGRWIRQRAGVPEEPKA